MLNRLKLCAGIVPAIAVYLWYAHERFGGWIDTALSRWYLVDPAGLRAHPALGPFSLHYFSVNFWTVMFAPPQWIPRFPFFTPHLYGQAIWTVSPAFILALMAPWNLKETWLYWLAFALVLGPAMLVYNNGQEQFGFRYAIMTYPFLLLLMARGWANSQLDRSLVVASIILTTLGIQGLRYQS